MEISNNNYLSIEINVGEVTLNIVSLTSVVINKEKCMSRTDKILKQWRESGGKGKAYSVTEVIAVLENSIDKEYLTFSKGGSHFCHIIHPKLNEIPGVNELGILAVVRKGNKVWRWYIDRIIQAIDILDKEENQE